jgi:hypothetical protein
MYGVEQEVTMGWVSSRTCSNARNATYRACEISSGPMMGPEGLGPSKGFFAWAKLWLWPGRDLGISAGNLVQRVDLYLERQTVSLADR